MKHLLLIILTLLATAMTVLIMPALTLFRQPPPKPVFLTQIKTIRWKQEPTPEKTARLAPLPPQPNPQPLPPHKPLSTLNIPHPAPPPPPRPPLHVNMPRNTLDLNIPPVSTSLDFPLEQLPDAPPTEIPAADLAATPAATAGNQPGNHDAGSASDALSADIPQDTPLMEKQVFTPCWPRNTIPVAGSLDLEFTVRTDGTVSDIIVIRCDSQLSFKYRREAIRATQRSTYYPPRRNGKPFPIRARRTIHFTLP